jgi:hypothetical protein
VLSKKREPIELGVADLWHLDTKAILEPLGYQVPMTPCGAVVAVGCRFPTQQNRMVAKREQPFVDFGGVEPLEDF